ncbi:MAG: hypothetical protein R3A44_32710 [Caldilineaceae bacterium]
MLSVNKVTIALAPTLLLAALLLSACGPIAAQEIVRVTPLPGAAQAAATPQPIATTTSQPAAARPTATPIPLNVQLEAGSAAAIAMATDAVMKPEIDTPIQFDESPVPITFDEFYTGFDMRKGLILTDKLRSLDGQEVVMEGYMAPPLKPQIDWFVLTSVRLEFCPFCSSDADWPTDIAVVYLKDGALVATQVPVRIQGRMEIGQSVDPETGMVSLVRIYADDVKLLQ